MGQIGHEPMGVVHETGDAVKLVKEGDRVVMPFNISCGVCLNCIQGLTNACLTTNSENPGAAITVMLKWAILPADKLNM